MPFFTCYFDLRQTGSFSATDPFLTTFIMLKNEMGSYVRIRGRDLKILTYPYMRVGGSKIAKIILTLLMNGSKFLLQENWNYVQ